MIALSGRWRGHPFVRFHAWQSIFAIIGVCVAYTGVGILHGMAAALWPGFSLLGWLAIPMGVLFFLIWVAMIVSAAQGKKLKGPFVGSQAEKQIS